MDKVITKVIGLVGLIGFIYGLNLTVKASQAKFTNKSTIYKKVK